MKIVIEQYPNPDCIGIHMDRKLQYFSTEYDKTKAFAAYPWLADIDGLNGVKSVSTHAYDIQIVKGKVFSWERILPVVVRILQREFSMDLEYCL